MLISTMAVVARTMAVSSMVFPSSSMLISTMAVVARTMAVSSMVFPSSSMLVCGNVFVGVEEVIIVG